MKTKKYRILGISFFVFLLISFYGEYQNYQVKKENRPGKILQKMVEDFDFDGIIQRKEEITLPKGK